MPSLQMPIFMWESAEGAGKVDAGCASHGGEGKILKASLLILTPRYTAFPSLLSHPCLQTNTHVSISISL